MPLLMAVTRSGWHDEGEIDGDIRKLLHNRRAESRADQEADISVRTRHEHFGMGIDQRCSEPRCRSLRTWRVNGVGRQVRCVTRDLSGCTRRCSRSPAGGRYDACTRAEVGLHHLDENVLGLPVRDVLLLLNELQALALLTSNRPERRREQLTDALWRNVVPKLPALLDAYTATGDAGAVCRALPRPAFDGFVGGWNCVLPITSSCTNNARADLCGR